MTRLDLSRRRLHRITSRHAIHYRQFKLWREEKENVKYALLCIDELLKKAGKGNHMNG